MHLWPPAQAAALQESFNAQKARSLKKKGGAHGFWRGDARRASCCSLSAAASGSFVLRCSAMLSSARCARALCLRLAALSREETAMRQKLALEQKKALRPAVVSPLPLSSDCSLPSGREHLVSSLDFLTQQLVKSLLLQRSREILLKVSGFSPVLCSPQKRHARLGIIGVFGLMRGLTTFVAAGIVF